MLDTLTVIAARNNEGLGVNFRIHIRTSTPMLLRLKKKKGNGKGNPHLCCHFWMLKDFL